MGGQKHDPRVLLHPALGQFGVCGKGTSRLQKTPIFHTFCVMDNTKMYLNFEGNWLPTSPFSRYTSGTTTPAGTATLL